MEKKFLTAVAITLFSGAALAGADNMSSTSSTTSSGSAAAIPFAELDANKDGALTKDELQRIPAIANNFGEIDFNGDGKIIEADYYALSAAIEAGRAPALPEYATLDVNRDGTVEKAEYEAFQARLQDIDKLMLSGKLGSGTTSSVSMGGDRGTSVQGASADSDTSLPSDTGSLMSPPATNPEPLTTP